MSARVLPLSIFAAFALALSACSQSTQPDGPPPLEGADIGGDFSQGCCRVALSDEPLCGSIKHTLPACWGFT